MKTLQIELPSEMDSEFKALGLTDDPGIAAWIANAIQEKLSATKQLRYLESRASRGSRDEFQKVLAKVPAAEPAIEDRW
jgi:hypothetical protein